MNSVFQKYKWLKYLVGGFIVMLGVLIIILACLNIGSVGNVINIVISVGAILIGIILLFTVLFSETHKLFTVTMVLSALLITTGILALISRFGLRFEIKMDLLVYLIGIYTIAFGALCIAKAVSLIVYKEKGTWIALLFVVAALAITVGILTLCFVGQLVQASYIVLGVSLVVVGILYIVFAVLSEKKQS